MMRIASQHQHRYTDEYQWIPVMEKRTDIDNTGPYSLTNQNMKNKDRKQRKSRRHCKPKAGVQPDKSRGGGGGHDYVKYTNIQLIHKDDNINTK